MRSSAPGFSDLAVPVSALELRAITRSIRPRLPAGPLDERRRQAERFRRAGRQARGVAAGAAAVEAAPGTSKEARLVHRITMGWTLAEQARIEEIGYRRYLDEQLDYEAIDDRPLEEALAEALPSLAMSPAELLRRYGDDPRRPIVELIVAAVLRAIYSPRQLFERLTVFWSDHFNIHLFSGLGYLLKPTDDREVIRRHALGRFPDLLSASAHSPAMLSYLTNDSNVRGHPNENYARELMELHTLGVDNGYTEKDVKEVARCFTGWTFHGRLGGADIGRFTFDARQHDGGRKRVLGRTIPAGGGIDDGERVLEILSGHANTAEFIAEKLLRYFWGYRPKRNAVARVAEVYLETGGDLRAMLRVVLAKGRMKKAPAKLKRPLHLTSSTLRALFVDPGNVGYLVERLYTAGHLPFGWAAPNGYPDSEAYWSGYVLPRWNFASTFLQPRFRSGIAIGDDWIDPEWSSTRIVQALDETLLGGRMTAATRGEVGRFLDGGQRSQRRLADAIGLVVASPEFQEY